MKSKGKRNEPVVANVLRRACDTITFVRNQKMILLAQSSFPPIGQLADLWLGHRRNNCLKLYSFFGCGEKKIDHDIVLWCSTILVIGIDIDPDIFTAILINTPIFGIQVQSIKLREHLRLLCWTVGKWICTFWSRLYLHERCCYSFVLLLLIPFSVTDHLSYEHSFVWWPWHILSVQM